MFKTRKTNGRFCLATESIQTLKIGLFFVVSVSGFLRPSVILKQGGRKKSTFFLKVGELIERMTIEKFGLTPKF